MSTPKTLIRLTLVAYIVLLTATALWSQPSEEPAEEAATESAPGPIPVEDLPLMGAETARKIRDLKGGLDADSSLLAIRDLIPVGEERLAALEAKTERTLSASPSLRKLRNLRSDWQGLGEQFRGWQRPVAVRIAEVGREVEDLGLLIETWQMTAGQAPRERLPEEVVAKIDRALSDLEGTQRLLYRRRNDLLTLEYEVADLLAKCENGISLTSAEIDRVRGRLLVTDAAPLWSNRAVSEEDHDIGLKVRDTLADSYNSLANYLATSSSRVLGHLAFYVAALICIVLLRRRAAAHADSDEAMARAATVLGRPVAAAIVVAIAFDWLFHPQPPDALTLLFHLLLLFPLLVMVPRLLPERFKPAVYALATIYIADSVFELLPQHSFTGRVLKLGIRLVVIFTALWLIRRLRGASQDEGKERGHRLAGLGLAMAVATVAVSAVADLAGNVALADVLLEGTIGSIYLGLLTWLAVLILRALVSVILNAGVAGTTRLVQRHGERLRSGIEKALNAAGLLVWLIVTLDGFKVLEPAYLGIRQALAASLRVGSLEVVMGDVVLFFLIIWLSFMISRILRAILNEEVYPRVRLPRGVPMAISKLAQLVILLVGFFFALGAAGVDLNRFTLLAGALGVGIGFGLQNVVSNLVSGIIVLLERPVQIGDKVRIGANEGEIRRIGLRATVVRTWEGAEVMVPNTQLVLDEVTNWTLSDQQRRIEVQVGVAYGSDTDRVSELLLKAARDHEDVLEQPEAYVVLTGFGDSSLSFSLRAWIGRFRDYLRVRSELTAAVHKVLAEAGITIPFPQRDVHLLSGDAGPVAPPAEKEE